MRLAGQNVAYKHVLKYTFQPRVFTRSSTTGNDALNHLPTDFKLPLPNPHAGDIAILGGGLTGLATAFHLTRQLPQAKITIYEKNTRLGGWVNSEKVKVHDGEVLFEWGPRTLRTGTRPAPLAMTDLVQFTRALFPWDVAKDCHVLG